MLIDDDFLYAAFLLENRLHRESFFEDKWMAKKQARELIKLVSEEETGYFYTTSKNKRNTQGKLQFKKYDPVVRKHVMFKEAKIK